MKLGRLLRLFNIIKTTENNDAGGAMSFPLCSGNYCLLRQNKAGHSALMVLCVLAAGEEICDGQTRLGNRPGVSRGLAR